MDLCDDCLNELDIKELNYSYYGVSIYIHRCDICGATVDCTYDIRNIEKKGDKK